MTNFKQRYCLINGALFVPDDLETFLSEEGKLRLKLCQCRGKKSLHRPVQVDQVSDRLHNANVRMLHVYSSSMNQWTAESYRKVQLYHLELINVP